jgi:transcriptional regulator with XRE-family HTH domain
MNTLPELGETVARQRRERGLTQEELSRMTGLSRETIARFERGQLAEFGSRKLLSILGVLGLQITFTPEGYTGTLDELRRERSGS